MSREKKVLFVTGASSDVGQALILQIADQYDTIVAHYCHSHESIDALAQKFPGKIQKVKADLADPKEVRAMIDGMIKEQWLPDHIVHLAAPKTTNERFHKMDPVRLDQAFEVSVRSIFHILQSFVPHMSKQKYGRVVFMLTSYCLGLPPKYQSAYVTSKYALLGLMKALATEYDSKGITVNGISPEMIDTKFLSDLPDLIVEENAAKSPLKRNLQVDDVVPMLAYLLSDAAEGGCFYKDKYRRDPYLSGSAFSDRCFALLQRDELLCDQWQYPASSAGKGKYLVPLADSSTAGDFLLYIKLYRIHFGCLLGRCQPAEEFFEVLPFWHLLSDHALWSDHTVSGDRTGFVCGKQN